LITDIQLISTNPGVEYEAFTVSSGGVGNITTTFSLLNDYLSWQNLNFTNGEAYFCEEQVSDQIDVLFLGLSYATYPSNCFTVSLLAIPGMLADVFQLKTMLT
jgi:hypothetical protein